MVRSLISRCGQGWSPPKLSSYLLDIASADVARELLPAMSRFVSTHARAT
jgi:hypothetical protein